MEKVKQLDRSFQLPYYACDMKGCWTPAFILAWMQEISGAHSELLGCGRKDLIKENIVWILSRIEVEMNRYPLAEEEITVTTFPKENRRWFFPRYYVFQSSKGEVLGKASALWALLDINERKMVSPEKILPMMPDNRDIQAPMGFPSPSKTIGGKEKTWQYKPMYEDIDVNEHVNNTRYMTWLLNALEKEVVEEHVLESFCINYDAEILPDANLTLTLRQEGMECSLTGVQDGKNHFEISGVLRKRIEGEHY
ncbi:MAG: hypothetical protein GX786_00375 [Clostridiales bacterium]|nr:hypothetical protein [Clostridiales bacterium]